MLNALQLVYGSVCFLYLEIFELANPFIKSVKKITSSWGKLRLPVFQCTWKIHYWFNADSNMWEAHSQCQLWHSLMSAHFPENFFHLFTFIEISGFPLSLEAQLLLKWAQTLCHIPLLLNLAVEKCSLLLIAVFRIFFLSLYQ